MPEISDYNLYDVNRLIHIWECEGWKGLAPLGEDVGIYANTYGFGCPSHCMSHRIQHGFLDIYEDMMCEVNIRIGHFSALDLLNLGAHPHDKLYSYRNRFKYIPRDKDHGGSVADDARLKQLLHKTIKVFVESKTFEEAFSKIGTQKNRDRYIKYWDFDTDTSRKRLQKIFSVRITGKWIKAMEWLLYGLRSDKNCEETWWNCVWLFAEQEVNELLEIQDRIKADIPLTDEQFCSLNYLISYGYPRVWGIREDDGSETYKILLETDGFVNTGPLYRAAYMLLVQPAFALAQDLQKNCSKPRFVRQCRAPSCGKLFYTRRANATACSGSQGDKKNMCALEWVRYKRYLLKIDKNPATDWDNEDLKKQFISYDNS